MDSSLGDVPDGPLLLVWGNCQAEAVRRRLVDVAAAAGLTAFALPPVHEISAGQRDEVHALAPRVELLVTQPISDEYRVSGLGSERLAAAVGGRTVTFPVVFLEAWFPWQVYLRDAADVVVDAPLTVYHDLRMVLGLADDGVSAEGIRAVAEASHAELDRRQQPLDVQVGLDGPGSMVTINHPAGPVVDDLARQVALVAGLAAPAAGAPTIGLLRTPLERPVLDALGHPDAEAHGWTIAGRAYDEEDLRGVQEPFYAANPELVAYARARYADRIRTLAG